MGDEEKMDDMEDSSSDSGGQAQSGGGSLSKIIKILLYVVGGILLILLVIGISYLVSKYVQEKSYQKEQDVVVAPPPPPLSTYDLPAFSVTTNDPEPHFVKMTVALGYDMAEVEMASEIIQRTPQMQDMINIIMGGKSIEDLNSIEDRILLKEEIKAHINSIMISGKIKEIYLKEFMVN